MEVSIATQVQELAWELFYAADREDVAKEWEYYNKILQLCEELEGATGDHPFQWETLADFTSKHEAAVEYYQKALRLAQQYDLPEYEASIELGLARQYLENGKVKLAEESAKHSNEQASKTDDLSLRQEISEFMLELYGST